MALESGSDGGRGVIRAVEVPRVERTKGCGRLRGFPSTGATRRFTHLVSGLSIVSQEGGCGWLRSKTHVHTHTKREGDRGILSSYLKVTRILFLIYM